MPSEWYKDDPEGQIWWKETPGIEGEFIFSFDKKTEFNMYQDYPWKLTPEQKEIFDAENPFWADYFEERTK